jgi:hypothetical protein
MKITELEAMALYTVLVGTLDDANPIGGISQLQRSQLVHVILNKQDEAVGNYDLSELAIEDNGQL